MSDDLNDYERRRLENIKRNEDFLSALGLGVLKQSLSTSAAPTDHHIKKKNQYRIVAARDKKRKLETEPSIPTRRSKRLNNEAVVQEVEDSPMAETIFRYDIMPEEGSELDDFEFQVFTELRKWRLLKSRELGIEGYKIFQNKTICQLIRRRRNDPAWAVASKSSSSPPEGIESDVLHEDVVSDLLQCWGIGPAKVKPGGFAISALQILNDPKNVILLQESLSRPPEHFEEEVIPGT